MKKPAPPIKVHNASRRAREYLTPQEIDRLIAVARDEGRHGHRDATMILMAYRHGLRVSELVSLQWLQIDLKDNLFHLNRRNNGINTTHPLFDSEVRALRKLKRNNPDSSHIFMTERKAPITASTVRKIVARAGEKAELGLPVHPHMLRHSTGFKLASEGHDTHSIQQYLGHKNIQYTVRYADISSNKFKDFWKD